MANDYIKGKWRKWFKTIDIKHRGEISKADVSDHGEKFAQLSRMNESQKRKMKETMEKVWDDIILRGRSGGIKEETFVEMNTKLYTADKAKFKDEMRKGYTVLFSDVLDVDRDGLMTEDEYVNYMRALGHENIELIKKFFRLYNPDKGKVTVKALIDSWVQFTSSDDSTKRDLVKEGIETCL